MAPATAPGDLSPLLKALGRDNASQYRNLRPIVVALGFALALLFMYTLQTNPDQLVLLRRGEQSEDSSAVQICSAWFEERDRVYGQNLPGRDFDIEPVNIYEVGLPEWFVAPEKDLNECDIKCRPIPFYTPEANTISHWDATTDEWPKGPNDIDHSHGFAVIRNIEPPIDFPGLAIDTAHKNGYDIVSTSELRSDVPIPYVGAYVTDFYAPGFPFEEKKRAAMAVISNCAAKSFRIKALEKMMELGIQIDSYGFCAHNKDFPEFDNQERNEAGQWDRYRQKIAVARTYMFYLAFENSHWQDYVTEKFYHVLQAGSVPVVIGAPNVAEFAPSPNSFLYLEKVEDVPGVVERMKYLMENRSAYEEMLEWRRHEASDSFKAINDVRGVHATCRLCIHIATKLQAQEENETRAILASISEAHQAEDSIKISLEAANENVKDKDNTVKSDQDLVKSTKDGVMTNHTGVSRGQLSTKVPLYPCTCFSTDVRPPSGMRLLERSRGGSRVHRLWVRESGRFRFRQVLVEGEKPSVRALHAAVLRAFQRDDYEPAWVERRRQVGLNWTTWHVHRVQPVGITLRDALEGGSLVTDGQLQEYLKDHPCPRLEVVLV